MRLDMEPNSSIEASDFCQPTNDQTSDRSDKGGDHENLCCRPHEGSVRFNVELSAMASPAFDGRASGESRLLARALERNLRDSGMLDMEALCVAAGRKVRSFLALI